LAAADWRQQQRCCSRRRVPPRWQRRHRRQQQWRGQKNNNNQLKAAAATVTETATMTATTMTMKTKATVSLRAARCRRWQRASGGESAAEAGSAVARQRRWRRQCYGGDGGSTAMAAARVCIQIFQERREESEFTWRNQFRLPSPHRINVSVREVRLHWCTNIVIQVAVPQRKSDVTSITVLFLCEFHNAKVMSHQSQYYFKKSSSSPCAASVFCSMCGNSYL
jgi:hypothetical protein